MTDTLQNIPNWAEQLEAIATAIGVFVAILGAYFAWKSLSKELIETKEILVTLAKQTEALTNSVNTDSKILWQLTELVKSMKEIQELQNEKDKARVKPDIKISNRGSSILHSNNREYVHSFEITNEGFENAIQIVVIFNVNEADNFKLRTSTSGKDKLINDKRDCIPFSLVTTHGTNIPKGDLGNIVIMYLDIYNNMYTNEFQIEEKDNYPKISRIYEDEDLIGGVN